MADSLSPATVFSWLIAIVEARQAGYPAVEPEHMLIGLCSLDKMQEVPAFVEELGEEHLAAFRSEQEIVDHLLDSEGWDATNLRRRLRSALGQGPGTPPEDGVYHRSTACRKVFDAISVVAGRENRPVTTIDFLVAATASPTPLVRELFPEPVSNPEPAPYPEPVPHPEPIPHTDPSPRIHGRVFFSYSAEGRTIDPAKNEPTAPGTSGDVAGEAGSGLRPPPEGDGRYVRRLAEFFEKRGISCWYAPRNIRIGEKYPAAIVRGIRSCRVMIVVISSRTKQEDGYIENEVEMANTHHLAIAPLLLEGVTLEDNLAFLFGTYQKFYAPSREDESSLQLLFDEIAHHLSKLAD